jgi:hypothetical protein
MRFYKSEPFEVKSMFVPDMTPWDQIFKVAEKQQQKFDKAEVEANTIDALKLRGGYSTNEEAAPEYNKKLESLKNQASKSLSENNLVGAQTAIQQARALATSPEALTIKTDEDFTMKHPSYVMDLETKDRTAIVPWMEIDPTTNQRKVKQAKFGEIFDPLQRYSYTPTGKGYHEDYSSLLNTFHVQYENEKPKYELIEIEDPNNPGKKITVNQKTGLTSEKLEEEFFKDNLTAYINADPESFRAMSGTLKWEEGKENRKISNEELVAKIMAGAKGRFYSKETPTLSQSNLPGYKASKDSKDLHPKPNASDRQITADMGYYNVSTGESKKPSSYDAAKEFLKSYNRESYLSNLLKENNVSLGTPEETLKRIKGIVSRGSDLNPDQLKTSLISAGVYEDKASQIANDLSNNLFSLEAQKNNLEQSLSYVNNKAAEGLNLKYDRKTGEYESNASYDIINKAELNAKNKLNNKKNSLNEVKVGNVNLIDLSSTVAIESNKLANEVLKEWKDLESSLNPSKLIELSKALANPSSPESQKILADNSTYLALEGVYTQKYYDALQKDYTIQELQRIDPDYASYITNRENFWSELHKETQMGLDIYDVNNFGKVEGQDSAGQVIKRLVGNSLDNYKFYNSKNIDITNDILAKKDNKFNLETGVDENASVIVSDPYNGRFLLKVLTGEPTESGKVKKGEGSNFVYADITDEVVRQVKNGLLPQEFLQDFNYIHSAWNEIKQLPINQEKSLNDILRESNNIYGTNLNFKLKLKRDSNQGYTITDEKNNKTYYSKNKKDLLTNINQIIQASKMLSASTSGGDDMGKQNFFNSRTP